MTIKEILKHQGLASKDIEQRFKNNQILLNGQVTKDTNLDVNENFIMSFDEYIYYLSTNEELDKMNNYRIITNCLTKTKFDFSEFFGNESDIEFINSLKDFHCLKISKGEYYILIKNDNNN